MDGASIHCDANIVYYLRSLGIKVMFLPAYCPFFNPIEIVFGLIKRVLCRIYDEKSGIGLELVVARAMDEFLTRDMSAIFRKCGYTETGFDAGTAFDVDLADMNGFEEEE